MSIKHEIILLKKIFVIQTSPKLKLNIKHNKLTLVISENINAKKSRDHRKKFRKSFFLIVYEHFHECTYEN